MGDVILFDKAKKKKKEFNSSKKIPKMTEEKTTSEGSRTDLDYSIGMDDIRKEKYWKNIEKEEDEKFRDKYKDVLAAVPVSACERMQHFSKVMLYLLSDIFHGPNPDTRFEAWMDFCEFYISYFDSAYSDYLNANKGLERQYQYKFGAMAEEELEEELVDCLGTVKK